jgi:hypothetical protein
VIERHPHGASAHPPLSRPGNGYGRSTRPGPNQRRVPKAWRGPALSVEMFVELATLRDDPGRADEELDRSVN